MPVVVACLVPAAPLLLPALSGGRVPEVAPVRAAVVRAMGCLVGLDRVLVVAHTVPGTLAGFGAPAFAHPPADRGDAAGAPAPRSWPHELALALLEGTVGVPARRDLLGYDDPGVQQALEATDDVRTGLLLLADGSRTRGARAPGGDDPRGALVDAELEAALRHGRPARAADAGLVGATAVPAVALLAGLRPATTEVLHAGAPLGVCYLVAVRRRGSG